MRFVKGDIVIPVESVFPNGALAVDGYGEGGSLLAHPLGGGLQYQFAPGSERQFRIVPKSEQPLWKRAKFAIEGIEDEFSGWTDGRCWNGWAMPHFELTEAKRVVELLTDGQGRFDAERDCFVTPNTDGEEVWAANTITALGGAPVKVYGVGAGSWIWDQVE